jgi:hypothetical protein
MYRICLTGFAAMVVAALAPVAARGAVLLNSVNQGFYLNANSDNSGTGPSGGGGNGALPLVNYNESLTNGTVVATATQTITGYTGPAAVGQSALGLSIQASAAATVNSAFGAASSDLTLNFTLGFGQTFSYARTAARDADVKLLYQGLSSTSEIAPGSGVLGAGTYILQVHAVFTDGDSVDLQILPDAVPEPTGLAGLFVIASLISRRRKMEG